MELALIKECIKNNAAAQRELYNRYSAKMLSVCYRFAGNREDAEDMLQEGFIKVFTNIKSFEGKGSFEGWVRKIMVHTCINYLKRNKKFGESVQLEYAGNIEIKSESVAGLMQVKQIVECIRQMPIGYRTVLNLYAIEGFSHKEIGEILEIQESTSRSQFTRAKNILEQILVKKKIITNPNEELHWAAGLQ